MFTERDAELIIFNNLDSSMCIVNTNEEWGGGDSAQREGMWYFGLACAFPAHRDRFAQGFARTLQMFKNEHGEYFRHPPLPGCPSWYADPNDFSRDQSIPIIIAARALGLRTEIYDFFKRTVKNAMRAQNGDPFWWPYHWGMWARAEAQSVNKRWVAWINPALWLGDITLIFASIFACLYAKWNPQHSDDLNFTMILMQSNYASTPLAKIARYVFANYRPKMPLTYETWGPASALEAYFGESYTNVGAPRIDVLYNKSGILKNFIR